MMLVRISLFARFLPLLLFSGLFSIPLSRAQSQSGPGQQGIRRLQSVLTVEVREPDGSPLGVYAVVNLYALGGDSVGSAPLRGGRAEFRVRSSGRYTVEVSAPGYEKHTEQVELGLGGQRQIILVTLVPEGGANTSLAQAGAPILSPNAQKELSKALEAIRENKLNDARKHLEKVSQAAPANPDVNYLWGSLYSRLEEWATAKTYWEKAVQIYPHHAFSLAALAQLTLREGDLPGAIRYFERAVEAQPSSWRFQAALANACLRNQEFEKAQSHAERAIELGKDRAGQARIILAQALLEKNDRQRAVKTLETFLSQQPSDPLAPEAHRILNTLVNSAAGAAPAASTVAVAAPVNSGVAFVAGELALPTLWMPPDVDENMPATESGVACPLQEVLDEAGIRLRGFVDAVNRISATESLDDEILDRSGFPTKRESRTFSYVASIQESSPGLLRVDEYRNGSAALDLFPQHIATLGLTSLALIFHPMFKDDYDFSCEGLSRWRDGLAWQVHFRQNPQKPARMRGYRTGDQFSPVALRGRAWIATDTFQVVSLETDIVAPIPKIRLKAEHISIEYAPVRFRKNNQELWLPQNAELFFDYGGQRMHRRHHLHEYMLFSVDEKQRISPPKMETGAAPGLPESQHNL